MNRILFIEDNRTKAEDVMLFLNTDFNILPTLCDSFRSGLKEIMTNEYDLLLLDMTLPTWEKSATSYNGNDFERLGGYLIMKEMRRKKKLVPTILITMFDEFGVGDSFLDLKSLNEICSKSFNEFYLGAVYYSAKESRWKDELKNLLNRFHEHPNNR